MAGNPRSSESSVHSCTLGARHRVAATLPAAVMSQDSTGWQACPGFRDTKSLQCGGGTAGRVPLSSHTLHCPGVTPVSLECRFATHPCPSPWSPLESECPRLSRMLCAIGRCSLALGVLSHLFLPCPDSKHPVDLHSSPGRLQPFLTSALMSLSKQQDQGRHLPHKSWWGSLKTALPGWLCPVVRAPPQLWKLSNFS